MRQKGGEPLVLFHASDLHFGAEDRAALDWFAREVDQERPAAVICTGDLTMRGSAREFAAAQGWLAHLPVPVMLEPGNHDLPYYHHMARRLTRPFERFRALEAAIGRGPAPDEVCVIPLCTVAAAQLRLNWSKGRISDGALNAALADLAAQAYRPLRLIAAHHPLIEADTQGTASTRGGKRALAALARAGADAILTGHVHDPFDRTVTFEGRAIRMIGAGTLSQRLRTTPPSYNRLEWSAAGGLASTVQTMA